MNVNKVSGGTWHKVRARVRREAQADNAPCALCGQAINYEATQYDPAALQVDHIIPLARGGPAYEPTNLQVTHRYCNRLKSNKQYQPPPVTSVNQPTWY